MELDKRLTELEHNFKNTLAFSYVIDYSTESGTPKESSELGTIKVEHGKAVFRREKDLHKYEYEIQEIDKDNMGFKYTCGPLIFHFRVHPNVDRIPFGGDVKQLDKDLHYRVLEHGLPFKFEFAEYDDVTYYYYKGKIYEELFYIGD
ncbi:MAG: hypothetical protein IJ122_06190 [Methanobrevibacter sp.]|nr:hypothetical protein [Methanobrevibacter sp.]